MAIAAPKIEIRVGSTWTDISAYVRDDIDLTRGRGSATQQAGPQAARLTLNNADGRFSPRNPTGPYYGSIGRNTPLRISYAASTSFLNLPPTTTSTSVSCPDTASLSITGDIDLRADLWLSTWRPYDGYKDLLTKSVGAGQASYALGVNTNGTLRFAWSADGTTILSAESTVPLPQPNVGRRAVRVTLDVNNGAGGNTATFYTSPTLGGSWTALGAAVITAGTTSIFNSTSSLYAWTTGTLAKYYGLKVMQGIAGTERGNPDFTAQTDGAASFADAAGNTWTVASGASLVKRDYRFYGEVSEWPSSWGFAGRDVAVPIEASGVTRRLGQGSASLDSAYRRGCTSTVAPVASLKGYWPCEDPAGAQVIASGLTSGPEGSPAGGVVFASDGQSFACSDALPVHPASGGSLRFTIPGYTNTGQTQVRFLLAVPAAGTTNGTVLCRMICSGTAARWDLVYGTGGTLTLNAYNALGTSILSDGPGAFLVDGNPMRISMQLTQNGADIDYTYATLPVGKSAGSATSATLAGNTVTICKTVNLAGPSCTTGQLTLQSAVTSVFDLDDQLSGYFREIAAARIARIVAEENLTSNILGDWGATFLNCQTQEGMLSLLRNCESADAGILYEPRTTLGIAYRTVRGLCLQDAAVTLDYGTGVISDIRPVEDDQAICNDMTASRSGGSSVRYTASSGTMSTLDPPSGVGTYDSSTSANVASDGQLLDVASWAVHLGTVDEARYPAIEVVLNRANIVADTALAQALTDLEVGDRIVITNPPAWLSPDDISQIVVGYTERLNRASRALSIVCMPESAYRPGIYGTATQASRYSPDSTVTAGTMTSGATSRTMTVAGALWTTAAGDFPQDVMIGGEQITVSSITGTSSPQTFNFSARAVNGVTKAHAAGESVTLYQGPVYIY